MSFIETRATTVGGNTNVTEHKVNKKATDKASRAGLQQIFGEKSLNIDGTKPTEIQEGFRNGIDDLMDVDAPDPSGMTRDAAGHAKSTMNAVSGNGKKMNLLELWNRVMCIMVSTEQEKAEALQRSDMTLREKAINTEMLKYDLAIESAKKQYESSRLENIGTITKSSISLAGSAVSICTTVAGHKYSGQLSDAEEAKNAQKLQEDLNKNTDAIGNAAAERFDKLDKNNRPSVLNKADCSNKELLKERNRILSGAEQKGWQVEAGYKGAAKVDDLQHRLEENTKKFDKSVKSSVEKFDSMNKVGRMVCILNLEQLTGTGNAYVHEKGLNFSGLLEERNSILCKIKENGFTLDSNRNIRVERTAFKVPVRSKDFSITSGNNNIVRTDASGNRYYLSSDLDRKAMEDVNSRIALCNASINRFDTISRTASDLCNSVGGIVSGSLGMASSKEKRGSDIAGAQEKLMDTAENEIKRIANSMESSRQQTLGAIKEMINSVKSLVDAYYQSIGGITRNI